MDGNNGRKAVSLMCALAFAMVAFLGFALADLEPVLTEPVVDVDVNKGYVGDTFTFTVEGYDPLDGYNNTNISVSINIDDMDYPMEWNDTNMEWVYAYDSSSPGIYETNITVWDTINEANLMYNDTLVIHVWEPVMYNDAYVPDSFEEDTTTTWDLSGAFTPAMDLDENNLTLGHDFPMEWTVVPLDDHTWNVTPPENFDGEIEVNVTASDGWMSNNYHVFIIDVAAVNDGPTIEYFMIDDVEVEPIMMNITTEWDDEGNATAWEWRNTVNLTLDEDSSASFMVNAMDVDDDELTYIFTMMEQTDGYMIENDMEMNSTGVNVTVPTNFTLTPDADVNGEFWGWITVADSGPIEEQVYLWIQIAAVNDEPTLDSIEVDVSEQVLGSTFVFTGAGSDIDVTDELNYTWKMGDTILGYGTEFSYVPDTVGEMTITLVVSDNTAMVSESINITVTEVPNSDPVIDTAAAASATEVEEGEDLTLTVAASDPDGDELTITWYNGDVVLGTGPSLTLNNLEPGTYTLTASITDGEATVTSEVTVTITKKEDEEEDFPIIIIIVIILAVIVLAVILFFVFKGGKEEEEAAPEETSEQPMEGEMPYEQPMEGEMPYEQPMEQPMTEQPMEGEMPYEQPMTEQPMEQPMEGEMPYEQPMEQPMPEQPMEQPMPEQPMPEQPAAPQEPVPQVPEAPPMAPPPAPPVAPQEQEEQQQ